jgi:hypothetical protein
MGFLEAHFRLINDVRWDLSVIIEHCRKGRFELALKDLEELHEELLELEEENSNAILD